MTKIWSHAKEIVEGVPMAMLTLIVVIAAFKALGWAVDKALPGKGDSVKDLVRI